MTSPEQVMLFTAGEKAYGIGLGSVRRVVDGEYITPIPRTAPSVAGAILFEGKAVPVFAVEPEGSNETGRLILVLQRESNLMGLVIGNVLRVVEPEAQVLKNGIGSGNLEGMPFRMLTTDELVPSGPGEPRGGENDEENPAGG